MSPSSPIFRLLAAEVWDRAQADGRFLGTEHDLRDGFIHFSSAEQVFNRNREDGLTRHVQEVTALKSKLRHKDEVLAEVMAEYVALKKNSGGV